MFRNCGSFQAVFFLFADSRRERGFHPIKGLYFCVGQQKKNEPLEKNSKKNRYVGTCKPTNSLSPVEHPSNFV